MTRTRTEIEELLPFLANETLEEAERREVEAAVSADPQLSSELAALRAIRANMQAEEMESSPGELGLARLMRDIDRETQTVAEAPADNVVPLRRLRLWQAAAMLVLGLGIGQAVLTTGPDVTGDSFELASGESRPADVAFRVIFAAETSEAEMRDLLLDAGVEIVAGPSALGFYDLAPLDGEAGIEAARAALQEAALIDTLEDVTN